MFTIKKSNQINIFILNKIFFGFVLQTDYNQLNNEHEKLKRELELTQLVDFIFNSILC